MPNPTDPTIQALNNLVALPINNLIVVVAIIALVILLGIVFLVWKFAPTLINLYKQQADTNQKLTQIAGQNSEQAKLAMVSVDKNTSEMVKQTSAIDKQTIVIEGQGRDLRSYQTLVSDTLSAHTEQIAINTKSTDETKKQVAELKADIEKISEQIQKLIDDKADCVGFRADLKEFEQRLMDKLATQPLPAVSNVSVDTPPAPEAGNQEAAA